METVPLTTADEDDEEFKSKTDQWLTYVMYKLHALLWIIIAAALAVYTDLYDVIVDGHPPARPEAEINRFAFNVGVAGFSGWLLMAMYLIIWLKYIKKIKGEWEEYWPQSIPIATALAVLSLISCVAPNGPPARCARTAATRRATVRPPLPRAPISHIVLCACLLPGMHCRFVIAIWPVWGWLSLPGIFVLFLGVLNLAHFVPL